MFEDSGCKNRGPIGHVATMTKVRESCNLCHQLEVWGIDLGVRDTHVFLDFRPFPPSLIAHTRKQSIVSPGRVSGTGEISGYMLNCIDPRKSFPWRNIQPLGL